MKQASLNFDLLSKKSRKQIFLDEMEKVVPWAELEALIAPYFCEEVKGRPPFALQTMLRVHFMQQWFTLSDPAMEEVFVDTPLYRQLAQIEEFTLLPDESGILQFGKTQSPRHRLEKHKMSEQMLEAVNDNVEAKGLPLKHVTVMDATLIAAPHRPRTKTTPATPRCTRARKVSKCTVARRPTLGNVHGIVEGSRLLHGEETVAFGDTGYQCIEERPDAKPDDTWHIAMRPGKRKALYKDNEADVWIDKAEKLKAGAR